MKLIRSLFTIHSWLGLVTGLFLLLLGLSGSVLVFRHELDRLANRELLTVQRNGKDMPAETLARCYQAITRRYSNLDGIAWMNPDAGPTDAYDFRLYLKAMQAAFAELTRLKNQFSQQPTMELA